MGIDAPEMIWDFFEQHPMARLATWSRLGSRLRGGGDQTLPAIHGDSAPAECES